MFTQRFTLLAGTLLLLSVTVVGDQNTPTVICNLFLHQLRSRSEITG
jgi:hypothetical protein